MGRRAAGLVGPHGLVITPNGRKVYVSSDGATSVSVNGQLTPTP